jgi:hypothetical protein
MPVAVFGRHRALPDRGDRAGAGRTHRGPLSERRHPRHIDTDALDLVARSFGSDYVRTHDTFRLDRPTWAGLKAAGKV